MARFRIYDNRPLRSVKVYLDGQLIKSTKRKEFSVPIHVNGVRTGRNRITVVAISTDGKRASKVRSFRRCRDASAVPEFTG